MLWIGSLLSLIKWRRVAQRWMAGDEPVTSLQECGVQGLTDRSRRPIATRIFASRWRTTS